jgi:hypothetical protein
MGSSGGDQAPLGDGPGYDHCAHRLDFLGNSFDLLIGKTLLAADGFLGEFVEELYELRLNRFDGVGVAPCFVVEPCLTSDSFHSAHVATRLRLPRRPVAATPATPAR